MPVLETFATDSLPPEKRLEYWNDLNSNNLAPTVTEPAELVEFCPSVIATRLDRLRLATVKSSPGVVHHGREHVARTREALFFLKIQLQGRGRYEQDGRLAELRAGDFTLVDSTRPYQLTFEETNKVLVLGIYHPVLRRHIACPESLTAFRMGGELGLNKILTDFAVGLWGQCSDSSIDSVGSNLVNALLSLTAVAYSGAAWSAESSGSARLDALRLRIIHYIETHLDDSDLSPGSIAAMLAKSPRYVHAVFTRGEETVSRYIQRRRLEECARMLASPAQRSRSISAIAFDYGFSSCTNFGKVFREHYGMTPSEYRLQHCRASGSRSQ
jgi:AraC-like DNA-binding protein/mannose-6-phosphate isomerase-like protein (cupin superfamily)